MLFTLLKFRGLKGRLCYYAQCLGDKGADVAQLPD